jgi:hypothetical protein
MLIRFAYLKMQAANQRYFTPGSAVTTFVESRSTKIDPLGGTGVNAPSTLITDEAGNRYFLNKTFSSVNAVITATTGTDSPLNLL